MKILISGSSGFIGRNIIKRLRESGHEIVKIKVFQRNEISMEIQKKFVDKQLLDLGENIYDVAVFIHLAWMDVHSWDSDFNHSVNQGLSHYLIDCLTQRGIGRVIVAGTCLEYGPREGEYDEAMEVEPQNGYGLAKYSLYKSLIKLMSKTKFELTWLRIFYIYGEDQPSKSIYGSLLEHISRGVSMFNMSHGQQVRDYLHINQVCRMIESIVLSEKSFGLVNLCSGRGLTLEQHVRQWLIELDPQGNVELNLNVLPHRQGEPLIFWGSSKKFERLSGKGHQ